MYPWPAPAAQTHNEPAQQIHPGDHHKPRRDDSGNFLPLPVLSVFPGLKMSDFGPWAQLNFSLCLKQAHTQKINIPQISFLISFLNTELYTFYLTKPLIQ